jgi:tryptophan-rich sensory protein
MKSYAARVGVFLLLNFGALGIGGLLMGEGPTGDWYQSLDKAPWTPPGWFFGVAWTTIMLCFSFYMAKLVEDDRKTMIYSLFGVQWGLNVGWNYIFFSQQWVLFGAIWISILSLFVIYFLVAFKSFLKSYTWLIVPYAVWLVIATSLNVYVLVNN